MSDRAPHITAYPTDWIEEQALQEISAALLKEGCELQIDRSMSRRSEVGLFLGHGHYNKPELVDRSFVMLHDLGQAHNHWPLFFQKEPWGQFDYGIVPNNFWLKMLLKEPDRSLKPRLGVVKAGWPKSDRMNRESITHSHPPAGEGNAPLKILYAPSWEFDNQLQRLVNDLAGLNIIIFIKQQYWEGMGHNERVNTAEATLRGKYKNVRFLNSKTRIYEVFKLADLIISDESSVLLEGCLSGSRGVSIIDWKIPDQNPPRPPSVPFPFVDKVAECDIRAYVSNIISQVNGGFLTKFEIPQKYSDDWSFFNPGQAAIVIAKALLGKL